MAINTRWFQDTLADRQMSQRGLARAMGLDSGAISLMFRGKRAMRLTEAASIAALLGVPAEDVIANAGVRISSEGKAVAITGYVDGTGEVHNRAPEPLGTVDHPGGSLPLAVSAVQCRTAGTELDHMDGWLLFSPEAKRGVSAEAIDRLSLCQITNGVLYLAKPTRSYTRGRWDLFGPSMTAKDIELEYATPVLQIIT